VLYRRLRWAGTCGWDRPLEGNLLGNIQLKDRGDWLAGSLGNRMRVWDVDGTGLAFPGAGFGLCCFVSSVSATVMHATRIPNTVAHAVSCTAVFVYMNITQTFRVHKFQNSPLLLLNVSHIGTYTATKYVS
jgi:hypothetical protein